ncbi:hypothetical protein N0V90_005201 [Kalmusia sp. IMI 367209]|nr:hypothetical protein N0V90_005201 [Kalmusia sp. IMI 367209]
MQPPFPCPTATWHNDTYEAIDPKKAEHSQAGKTVIITGAGSGIGRETAHAFAEAGAKHFVLIGRTEATLRETESSFPFKPESVSVFATSVTDETAIRKIAAIVGTWDVLVLNAAHISPPSTIAQTPLNEWWQDYEVNVKSVVIAAQAFIPTANKGAAIYGINAGAHALPPAFTPLLSGYLSSKVAQMKVFEFIAAENPELFVCSIHPGMIDTGIFQGSGADKSKLPMDTLKLPAHFLVWLTQPKTKFLHGKMVFANWDVDELSARAEEI